LLSISLSSENLRKELMPARLKKLFRENPRTEEEVEAMRKGLITILCIAGMMLWGATAVNAIVLNWTLLEHASVAGKGPGADGVIGTADDTLSGEGNGCNFSTAKNCTFGSTPAMGTYSFTAFEYTNPTWYSCLDLQAGPTAGAPCVCAEGGSCQSDADCTSSTCAGAGDCCPGPLNACAECTDNPSGYDTYAYFGSDSTLGPAPHLTTCQAYTTNNVQTTAYQLAASESVVGSGGGCLNLNPSGGPYLQAPCGVGPITAGNLDVDLYVYGCVLRATTLQNITYTGRIVDMDAIVAVDECGYSYDETVAMVNNARAQDASAEYLMVMCGQTVVPMDAKAACLRGAAVDFVLVTYTSEDASSCPGSGCP
jgi:hypothetical protein